MRYFWKKKKLCNFLIIVWRGEKFSELLYMSVEFWFDKCWFFYFNWFQKYESKYRHKDTLCSLASNLLFRYVDQSLIYLPSFSRLFVINIKRIWSCYFSQKGKEFCMIYVSCPFKTHVHSFISHITPAYVNHLC